MLQSDEIVHEIEEKTQKEQKLESSISEGNRYEQN